MAVGINQATEGQYFPVRLELARLVRSLLYSSWVMLVLNEQKNTQLIWQNPSQERANQHAGTNKHLTTALQSGGWVPETSRSFHYSQPAPSWRPLLYVGKSRQPSHGHPRGRRKKTGSHHTDKTVERKGGTGEGRQPPRSPHAQEKCWLQRQQNRYNALWTKNRRKPGACAYLIDRWPQG